MGGSQIRVIQHPATSLLPQVVTIQPSAPQPPILGMTNGYFPKIGGRGLNRYPTSLLADPHSWP
jgi:hypothetical protein